MKVVVYPADRWGCGHHRLIWPAEALRRAGHDVEVIMPSQRRLQVIVDDDRVTGVQPPACDVMVMQRVTHRWVSQAIPFIRAKGIAVVVDVDDDLSAIHPGNPAFDALHPRNEERMTNRGEPSRHSWHHLYQSCRHATLVTVTTPSLLHHYGFGHGHVLPNYLADHYYDVKREDSDLLGWPAAIHSHPNDPAATGGAIARLVAEGHRFQVLAAAATVGRAFGLPEDPVGLDNPVDLDDWPRALAYLGVGIAPLADTRFNTSKSWLKPLELSAAGVPWVASPRVEYARLNRLGAGILADRPKTWYRELKRLLTSETRRVELSESGRSVAEELRLGRHAWRWWEAWERARELEHQVRVSA